MNSKQQITIGIIGAGNWGINHVRTFCELKDVQVMRVVDTDANKLERIQGRYPTVSVSTSPYDILQDPKIAGVVIAAPSAVHFQLAKSALLHGKDVFVEKPLTLSASEGTELVKLANDRKRILMVGHLLIYHPAVRKLKSLIDTGALGTVYYLYSQRLNLGTIRTDEDCMWSLAPHDLSVILYLLGEEPVDVTAHGQCYIQPDRVDVAFLTLKFADGRMAHVHTSWLDPHKVRKITLVGNKKMVVFDDMDANEKIKIYDKGTNGLEYSNYGESIGLRFGDVLIPKIPVQEPLKQEAEHFIQSIRTRKTPLTDGQSGLAVVNILERAQMSMINSPVPSPISLETNPILKD